MKKPLISKQVVQKFLEGKTTQMQNILIQQWLENADNRELYFQWIDEWETDNPQFSPDLDLAYHRSLQVSQHLSGQPDLNPSRSVSAVEMVMHKLKSLKWLAAAAITLLIGAYWYSDFLVYQRYETGYGEVRTVRLPDNSSVTLNANSVLKLPRFGFGKNSREVNLTGEAEFSVVHTIHNSKFIVHTPDHLEVSVLGTEFIVNSRGRGSKVVLSRGSVQLRSSIKSDMKPVLMKPGDVATMSTQGNLSVSHNESLTRHLAWKQHRFVFTNTPVSEIAYQISEHFGVSIIVTDPALSQRTLGGTFKATDPAAIVKVLADVLNANVTHAAKSESKSETYILNPRK